MQNNRVNLQMNDQNQLNPISILLTNKNQPNLTSANIYTKTNAEVKTNVKTDLKTSTKNDWIANSKLDQCQLKINCKVGFILNNVLNNNLIDIEKEETLDREDLIIRKFNVLVIEANKGIDRTEPITKITENIYIGQGRTTLYGETLHQLGITHILSVGKVPHSSVREGQFDRLEILDLLDLTQADILKHFQTFFDYMNKVVEDKGKVYIHCEMGCSRSATAVIAILRKTEFIRTLQGAYDYVKLKRPWICPNTGFQDQLRTYFNEPLICSSV
jgi:protein-tyrosine phosphatase